MGGKQERGEVGIDHGTAYAGHPEMAVGDCLAGLEDAVEATQTLAEPLERAARPLTYAHYLDPLCRDDTHDAAGAGEDVTGEDRP